MRNLAISSSNIIAVERSVFFVIAKRLQNAVAISILLKPSYVFGKGVSRRICVVIQRRN